MYMYMYILFVRVVEIYVPDFWLHRLSPRPKSRALALHQHDIDSAHFILVHRLDVSVTVSG